MGTFEGHEFYVLNLPGVGTYAYDISRIGTIEGAYGDSYARGRVGRVGELWQHPTFPRPCALSVSNGAGVGGRRA